MILVVMEHNAKQINGSSLAAITAAQQLGDAVDCMLVGDTSDEVLQQARSIQGIQQVWHCQVACFDHPLAVDLAALMVGQVKQRQYSHVLMAASSLGKDTMPRAAAQLAVGQISEVVSIIDEKTYCRPIYAGNAIATVKSLDEVQCVTVRGSAFDKAQVDNSAKAPLSVIDFTSTNTTTTWLRDELSLNERPDLADADIVISGGRGLKDKATFALLSEIADQLGAAMGASRAAVDADLVPNELQVGQTGQVVAPDLYIAVGISGAIQHLAGMKDSKVIVAINNDPDAPIFQIADYGLVADLFTVLPELKQQLIRGEVC